MERRRYLFEFWIAMGAYILLVVVSAILMRYVSPHSPLTVALALLPMVPACAVAWTVVRHLRRIDEMQRQVQLEALGLAFAGTALITFGYGFLETVGFWKLSMFWVWPVMAVLWIVGKLVAERRYR